MMHYHLYLIFQLPINLNWRWLLYQPIIYNVPKEADVEK